MGRTTKQEGSLGRDSGLCLGRMGGMGRDSTHDKEGIGNGSELWC